jgi:hypothetical protein
MPAPRSSSRVALITYSGVPAITADDRLLRDALVARGAQVVQPFLPEIREGEWSLIFLGGEFSHAVVKRPAEGAFRVQHDFGGTVERREPKLSLIDDARAVLRAAARATDTRVEEILYWGSRWGGRSASAPSIQKASPSNQ